MSKIPVNYKGQEVGYCWESSSNTIIVTNEKLWKEIQEKFAMIPISVSSRKVGTINEFGIIGDVKHIEHNILNLDKDDN